jgi:aspartyl-tRNA synthetase
MQRTKTSEISKHLGEQVTIVGFVHAIRNQGKIGFLRIRDRFGSVQSVVLKNHEEAFATMSTLSLESVVRITGLAKEAPPVPEKVEIEAETIEVLSTAAPELPIPVVVEKGGGESDVTLRFDWRWLDLRLPEKQKIFAVWTALEKGFRTVYEKEGFTQIYMPSLMNAPSESGAEVFEVNYFDRKAYLAQSPQFYKQMAMAAGFERVFMTGPVFRAELSFTTRHMTEFTGWDFEMSYIDSHHDVMDMEEKLLVEGFREVKKEVLPELEIPSAPFPRITLADAKSKLKKAGVMSEKVNDLSPDEERGIFKIVKEETGSDFVWITDYPPAQRAFYHMRDEKTGLTKGFDLLYKGIEVTTGAQREHRPDMLIKQANEKGLTEESVGDYLNFFRYGCPPHGGVGMGPGRMVMQILGLESVKEATFLPRDVKRLRP